jgi:hypothetical protein
MTLYVNVLIINRLNLFVMKKRIFLARGLTAALWLIATLACTKVENTAPAITFTRPANGAEIRAGIVKFTCDFSDDRLLKSYRLQVVAVDGGKVIFDSNDIDISGRSEEKINAQLGVLVTDLNGEDVVTIDISKATSGDYKFIVSCTDAAGNSNSVTNTVKVLASTTAVQ